MKTKDDYLIFKIDDITESSYKESLMMAGFVPGTIIHVKLKPSLGVALCRVRGADYAMRLDAYHTMWLKPTHC